MIAFFNVVVGAVALDRSRDAEGGVPYGFPVYPG